MARRRTQDAWVYPEPVQIDEEAMEQSKRMFDALDAAQEVTQEVGAVLGARIRHMAEANIALRRLVQKLSKQESLTHHEELLFDACRQYRVEPSVGHGGEHTDG